MIAGALRSGGSDHRTSFDDIQVAAASGLQQGLRNFESLASIRPVMKHLRFAAGADRGQRFTHRPYAAAAVAL
jgi:hypothetical protein